MSATAILFNQLWSRPPAAATAAASTPTGYFETNVDRLRAAKLIFRDLGTLAGDRRRTLLVIPELEEIDRARATGSRGSEAFLELLSALSAEQWNVVDLMPRLLAQSEDAVRELYLDCDGHWSARGHQFAMAALSADRP